MLPPHSTHTLPDTILRSATGPQSAYSPSGGIDKAGPPYIRGRPVLESLSTNLHRCQPPHVAVLIVVKDPDMVLTTFSLRSEYTR